MRVAEPPAVMVAGVAVHSSLSPVSQFQPTKAINAANPRRMNPRSPRITHPPYRFRVDIALCYSREGFGHLWDRSGNRHTGQRQYRNSILTICQRPPALRQAKTLSGNRRLCCYFLISIWGLESSSHQGGEMGLKHMSLYSITMIFLKLSHAYIVLY